MEQMQNQCHLSPENYSGFQTSLSPDASRFGSDSPHRSRGRGEMERFVSGLKKSMFDCQTPKSVTGSFLNDYSLLEILIQT